MSGLSDYSGRNLIDWLTGKDAMPSLPTAYLALITTAPSDANAGGVETDYPSYARKATAAGDWNAAAGSAPASATNAASIAFPTPTGDPSNNPVIGLAMYDAPTSGNLLAFDYLGAHDWQPFFANTTDIVSAKAHAFLANDRVVFTAEFGGVLPTGIVAGTIYHVIAANLATDAFSVSATQGGSAVDITATGSGMVRKVTPMNVNSGITPRFEAGALSLKAA